MQVQFSDIGTEPISYATAKAYMRLNSDADESYVCELITYVRSLTETITQRSLVIKTVHVFYDEWPLVIMLPYPEHDEITALTINGTNRLADIFTTGLTQKIITLPTNTYDDSSDDAGLKITYTTTGSIPDDLKQAMLKEINDQYHNRGSFVGENIYGITNNYLSMCLNHKVI